MWLARLLLTSGIGYLLGAIPTGLLVGRLYGGVDVRDFGSRSTGATNVLRTVGPGASAIVVCGDLAKGALAVLIARRLFPHHALTHALAALAVAIGHDWPVFARFHGGKGVLTSLGALGSLYFPATIPVVGIGAAVLWRTRYASLGSLVGTLVAPIVLTWSAMRRRVPRPYLIFGISGAALVVIRHHENIARLLNGTERRLGETAPAAANR